MITFVWAEDEKGVIGYEGKLPWHLPSDMKFFKEVTLTGDVVMGRKTYESIPVRPLKKRKNIVLTSDTDYAADPDVMIVHDKEAILAYAKKSPKDLHIIGGASLYAMFEQDVQKLYRTVIHHSFTGDTTMVPIDWSKWRLVSKEEKKKDEKNKYDHDFEVYIRKED